MITTGSCAIDFHIKRDTTSRGTLPPERRAGYCHYLLVHSRRRSNLLCHGAKFGEIGRNDVGVP